MPVRSGVLGRAVSAAGATVVPILTVASTDTALVKEVDIWNTDVANHNVVVYAQNAGVTLFALIFMKVISLHTGDGWKGWLALGPGDQLVVQCDGPGVYTWASGADLPGHL
jgi:hypothetical protein